MRIAVIRFSSLGDVLCTGPAVRGLRQTFPDAELVFVTTETYGEVAASLPGVDRVVVVERRGKRFLQDAKRLSWEGPWDVIADLQGSPRSHKLVKLLRPVRRVVDTPPRVRRSLLIATKIPLGRFYDVPLRMVRDLAPLGVNDDGDSLKIELPEETLSEAKEQWGPEVQGAVALIPGAKHGTKRWPGSFWAALVSQISQDRRMVILGSEGEVPPELAEAVSDKTNVTDLTGQTSILEMGAVLRECAVAVAGDTGPMHMAVAVGTPLVVMYGPTVREFGFFPFRAKSIVLERNLWCRPCSAHGTENCPLGHHRCLREIQPADVLEAVQRLERDSGNL